MQKKGKNSKTSSFGTVARVGHDASKFYGSRLYAEARKPESKNPQGQKPKSKKEALENPLPPELLNQIFIHSSEDMSELPDASVHLMISSPPYNVSKDYDENLSLPEYLALLRRVFSEVYRVLVWGGRACINVANIGRKPYIPLASHINLLMMELGFLMRGEIIWDKGASSGVSLAWGSFKSASNPVLRDTHEYILVFSKGDFKREKGEKRDTISKENFIEWSKSVWKIPAASAKKIGHPAPFPVELARRLSLFYSFEGDVILDPFMGSGSTALGAMQTGRSFVGYELSEDYARLARARIEEARGLF